MCSPVGYSKFLVYICNKYFVDLNIRTLSRWLINRNLNRIKKKTGRKVNLEFEQTVLKNLMVLECIDETVDNTTNIQIFNNENINNDLTSNNLNINVTDTSNDVVDIDTEHTANNNNLSLSTDTNINKRNKYRVVYNGCYSYEIIKSMCHEIAQYEKISDMKILKFSPGYINGMLRRNNQRRLKITAEDKIRPDFDEIGRIMKFGQDIIILNAILLIL